MTDQAIKNKYGRQVSPVAQDALRRFSAATHAYRAARPGTGSGPAMWIATEAAWLFRNIVRHDAAIQAAAAEYRRRAGITRGPKNRRRFRPWVRALAWVVTIIGYIRHQAGKVFKPRGQPVPAVRVFIDDAAGQPVEITDLVAHVGGPGIDAPQEENQV